jgi:hypothetical protein
VASTDSADRWRISARVPTSISSPARRIATRSLSASTSLALWLLLSVAFAATVPAAAYVFEWPLLLACIAWLTLAGACELRRARRTELGSAGAGGAPDVAEARPCSGTQQ